TTLAYPAEMAALVRKETGLRPHLNPGIMTRDDIAALRQVSVSQGIMLESASERLSRRGGPHFGSPDKHPQRRLDCIAAAGRMAVPFTSGILIGIGETRRERIEALLALRDLNERYGHIQEIIIQNFRAKPETRMAAAPEPDETEHLWTIAVARLVFGADMNIQAPPNLMPDALEAMIAAGINDWGGVSPVTPDHVNPEAPWPALAQPRPCQIAPTRPPLSRRTSLPRLRGRVFRMAAGLRPSPASGGGKRASARGWGLTSSTSSRARPLARRLASATSCGCSRH